MVFLIGALINIIVLVSSEFLVIHCLHCFDSGFIDFLTEEKLLHLLKFQEIFVLMYKKRILKVHIVKSYKIQWKSLSENSYMWLCFLSIMFWDDNLDYQLVFLILKSIVSVSLFTIYGRV